ncbi:TatD family deoxyribonuclease [Lysinibacillus yapensis]|uniref:TatD family deoxyribonuclease n=1 Tax=Ureibacillus yapensis TaxID=2304605 RepID=A0A396SHR0_9BACL|nr:TatD family hydrolase [Lysinibacillus yapensis]RHW31158.1 TatD family deoxyribonuclease [Lysinibacillus yapensis]
MMIDAHIHLDHYEEHEQLLLLEQAEALIAVSSDLASCMKIHDLASVHPAVKPAYGFHPEQSIPSSSELETLFSWMEVHAGEMAAVGEVGLPYYKNLESPLNYQPYIELLERFMDFAAKWAKPIVLHAVYEDASIACDLLEKHGVAKAHFHWFKGDEMVVKRMIRNGYFISVTPDCVYEKEIQQLIRIYPLQQMMVETDGPWPFEGPFRSKRTEPWMMKHSIEKIAEIKKLSIEETMRILYNNTKKFYEI